MERPTQRFRIIAEDDEPEMLRNYRRFIAQSGHDSLAMDGQKLLEQCRQHDPDTVIMDVSMPRLDGLTALRQIDTHCILVSADSEPELLDALRHSRCMARLIKPMKRPDLARALMVAADVRTWAQRTGSDAMQASHPHTPPRRP